MARIGLYKLQHLLELASDYHQPYNYEPENVKSLKEFVNLVDVLYRLPKQITLIERDLDGEYNPDVFKNAVYRTYGRKTTCTGYSRVYEIEIMTRHGILTKKVDRVIVQPYIDRAMGYLNDWSKALVIHIDWTLKDYRPYHTNSIVNNEKYKYHNC